MTMTQEQLQRFVKESTAYAIEIGMERLDADADYDDTPKLESVEQTKAYVLEDREDIDHPVREDLVNWNDVHEALHANAELYHQVDSVLEEL